MRRQTAELLSAFFNGELFATDHADTSDADLVFMYAVLQEVEKRCKDQKNVMRDRVIAALRASGSSPRNGAYEMQTGDGKALVSERVAKLPVESELRDLLRSKGIDLKDVYDRQEEWVLNPSRLERLIYNGVLDRDEVDALKTVTESLRVTPSKTLKTELTQLPRSTQE